MFIEAEVGAFFRTVTNEMGMTTLPVGSPLGATLYETAVFPGALLVLGRKAYVAMKTAMATMKATMAV